MPKADRTARVGATAPTITLWLGTLEATRCERIVGSWKRSRKPASLTANDNGPPMTVKLMNATLDAACGACLKSCPRRP